MRSHPVDPERVRRSLGQVIHARTDRTLKAGDLVEALLGAGLRVWAVGGAPREWLAGREAGDLDLYVERDLDEVHRVLREAFPGVDAANRPREQGILLRWSDGEHASVDVSILRSYRDIQNGDAWTTRFSPRSDLREDALMRDFSVNAFYYDFGTETLLDPLDCGLDDLRTRTLRVVSHPDVLAAIFVLTLRITLFSCRGYTPAENALAHLDRHADRDIQGMGPRLWKWIPKNAVSKGIDLDDFGGRLRPWLRSEESRRLFDQALADSRPA
ncbi:MAG: CCA tRNA nucleotidyltransferase [Acidobacteriota bacterium]